MSEESSPEVPELLRKLRHRCHRGGHTVVVMRPRLGIDPSAYIHVTVVLHVGFIRTLELSFSQNSAESERPASSTITVSGQGIAIVRCRCSNARLDDEFFQSRRTQSEARQEQIINRSLDVLKAIFSQLRNQCYCRPS